MNKEKIINNLKFRKRCEQFGLDWENFEIVDDMIFVPTPKENMYMLLDERYNIVSLPQNFESINILKYEYSKPLKESGYFKKNDFLANLSLKKIYNISQRTQLLIENYKINSIVIDDKEILRQEHNSYDFDIIVFIKFIEMEIENYWNQIYQWKLTGYEVPSIEMYLKNILIKIEECIEKYIENNRMPFSSDVLEYIGQCNFNNKEVLCSIINLIMMEKQYQKVEGTADKIRKISVSEIRKIKDSFDKTINDYFGYEEDICIEDNYCKVKK